MLKTSDKLTLIGCLVLAFSLNSISLYAQNLKSSSLGNEIEIPDYQISDIKIEQDISSNPLENLNNLSLQTEKPNDSRKSILNITGVQSISSVSLLKKPGTPVEAAQMGWKIKTVKTPQPISSLVKEVPKEITEKKARLKQKQKKIEGNPG